MVKIKGRIKKTWTSGQRRDKCICFRKFSTDNYSTLSINDEENGVFN